MNGKDSDLMKITFSVRQGSVLRPLLVLLFINDLPYASKKLKFHLFSADTNTNIHKLAKNVNIELIYEKRWLDANKLSLILNKTNYIIFHSPTITLPLDTVVKIGNKHISNVQYVNFFVFYWMNTIVGIVIFINIQKAI